MPYITASIIIQLLRVVIPLDDLHKEGQTGTGEATQYARDESSTGILQATTTRFRWRVAASALPVVMERSFRDQTVLTFIAVIIVMMAGTGVIMWLGELVTGAASAA